MQAQTFIFIGRSGCGKGTQAALLLDYISKNITPFRHIFYIETGERFRQFIKEHGNTSRLAQELQKKGARQPDFLAAWMWSNLLVGRMAGDEHLVLDGTPRSLPEAEILDTAMKFYERVKPNVVYLNIPRDVSRARLLARGKIDGRADDHSEEIERRLNWFETDVLPAIDFYRHNNEYNFIEIDGEKKVEDIHQEVLSHLVLTA